MTRLASLRCRACQVCERRGPVGWHGAGPPHGARRAESPAPNVALAISPMPASEPSTLVASIGSIRIFWFGELGELAERLDVLLGDEVIQRRDVALADRLAHHLGRLGLGLRARARAPRRRGTRLPCGLRPRRICDCFSPSARRIADWRWPSACKMSARFSRSAFICRPIACDQIGRRHDVLDLDAVDLDAPGRDRGVDHAQQPLVDLVAMRQHLVEVHRAHDRADVGHRQRDDRLIEIGDLVARLGGVEHLDRRRRRRP